MCDLLAISAGFNYTPGQVLPLFAEKAKENVHGWGIGFFRDGFPLVEKSAESVYQDNQMHDSFQRLARVIDSRMILAHISCPKVGGRHGQPGHPFTLSFLDQSWLFCHLGVIEHVGSYRTRMEPVLDVDIPSARVFEFLRDRMTAIRAQSPYLDLLSVVAHATRDLIQRYPGHYNYFLANESVLFAFFNFRQLMLLKGREALGDVLLLTTIEEGLSSEGWQLVGIDDGTMGKFVVVGGADFLYQQSLTAKMHLPGTVAPDSVGE